MELTKFEDLETSSFRSLQICGTSGSGKTTIVRRLLEDFNMEPIARTEKGKPLIYAGDYTPDCRLFVLGSYETTCGGCDTIPSVHFVADLLRRLDEEDAEGICVFEGLMISHMLGTVATAQTELGLKFHWRAYLDTELMQCLDNVVARRRERGQAKPFNPTNTQKDWPRVRQSRDNAVATGFTVRDIRFEYAYTDTLNILNEMEALC